VEIVLSDRVTAETRPDAPTIVATRLSVASRLFERPLLWPGARTALVDIVATRRPGWPSVVADVRSDLSTCCMIERETAVEPRLLGGDGVDLFQAQLGIGSNVGTAAGVGRIEDALDVAVTGWRERVVWRRGHVVVDSTGAVDPPGASWRDRPGIDQRDDQFLAGDAVAAPGMLSEVAVNSGLHAARLALAARRRRAFAVGWPSAELTPERRLAVLAAVLPGASLHRAEGGEGDADRWEIEPVDETGPGYRLVARAGMLRGAAVTSAPTGIRRAALAWSRWPAPTGRLLSRLLAAWLGAPLGRPRRR
jgi:hypothetical protein